MKRQDKNTTAYRNALQRWNNLFWKDVYAYRRLKTPYNKKKAMDTLEILWKVQSIHGMPDLSLKEEIR